jgi:ATP-dependent Lon protease
MNRHDLEGALMPETYELPVLPLTDAVVLPGMVLPVELDTETRAAVDAARTAADSRLLVVPRIRGAHAPVGVLAAIE